MNFVTLKYLPGQSVSIKGELISKEGNLPELTKGLVVGVELINIENFDEGVEYTVAFGDWVLSGVKEENLQRSYDERTFN